MWEDMLGLRGGKENATLFIIADCLVCVVSSVHTLLLPSSPRTLDWLSISAHQGVMESQGVWMDGGAGVTDSPRWNAILFFQEVLKPG